MKKKTEENNKKLVLEAFDTLFNKRDYAAAERYWSSHYIQHSNHIEPGREGLFNLIKSLPPTLKYEAGVIVAGGDFVIVHGRFSGFGRRRIIPSTATWAFLDQATRRRASRIRRRRPIPRIKSRRCLSLQKAIIALALHR